MNIAVFADLHGRILLAFKLCARWEKETGETIDLILQAGDLGAYPDMKRLDRATIRHAQADPSELGFIQDFATYQPAVAETLARTSHPMIFVRGNHEDHGWLDNLEHASPDAVFPVDAYQRLYCLKTGIPYTFTRPGETITVLGIGRTGPLPGEQETDKPKYIQLYEMEHLYNLGSVEFDVLLTHDTALNFVTPGYGLDEIRSVLDTYKPLYHFYGHTGESYIRRKDSNRFTQSIKMTDLHWDRTKPQNPLERGAMGILRWQGRNQHTFEVVAAEWLQKYEARSWRWLPD